MLEAELLVARSDGLIGGDGVVMGKFCGFSSDIQDIRATAERGSTFDRLGGDLATLSGGERPTEFE